MIIAGWVNRNQQDVIAYLQAENRVLREQLGDRRLLFTDGQRRRFAAKAKVLGRKGLFEITTLVTPDTLLRWYQRLIAKKYDGSWTRSPGRPKTASEIDGLIVRMARDNPRWAERGVRNDFEAGQERPLPLQQRKEVQAVLPPRGPGGRRARPPPARGGARVGLGGTDAR